MGSSRKREYFSHNQHRLLSLNWLIFQDEALNLESVRSVGASGISCYKYSMSISN